MIGKSRKELDEIFGQRLALTVFAIGKYSGGEPTGDFLIEG